MYTARIVVLTIALSAGGVAALSRAWSSTTSSSPVEPVAQLQTVDVLVAKSDIGLGQSVDRGSSAMADVAGGNCEQQLYPPQRAARMQRPRSRGLDCTLHHSSRASRSAEQKLVKANGSGFMAAILPAGMRAVSTEISPETGAGGFILPNDRVDVIPFEAREESGPPRLSRHRQLGNHPGKRSRSRDRSGAEGKRRPEQRGRQDRNARTEARTVGDAGPRAPERHAVAGAAQHRRSSTRSRPGPTISLRSAARASTWFATASQARRRYRSDRRDARYEVQGKSAGDADHFWSAPCRFRPSPRLTLNPAADAGRRGRADAPTRRSPPADQIKVRFLSLGIGKSVIIDLPRDVKDVLVADPEDCKRGRSVRRNAPTSSAPRSARPTSCSSMPTGQQIAAYDIAVKRDLNGVRAALRQTLPTRNPDRRRRRRRDADRLGIESDRGAAGGRSRRAAGGRCRQGRQLASPSAAAIR